jgi:hypothetical protein
MSDVTYPWPHWWAENHVPHPNVPFPHIDLQTHPSPPGPEEIIELALEEDATRNSL